MSNLEIIEKRLQTLSDEAADLLEQRAELNAHFRKFENPGSSTLEAWHKAMVEIETKLDVVAKNNTMLRELFPLAR